MIFLFIFLCSGCLRSEETDADIKDTISSENWHYDDLIFLDEIDSKEDCSELIAIYFRQELNSKPTFRLDFLDNRCFQNFTIDIAVDSTSGGKHELPSDVFSTLQYDYLLHIPASSPASILDISGQNVITSSPPIVLWDRDNDSVIIHLVDDIPNLKFMKTKIQVFISTTDEATVLDSTEPILLNPPAPIQQAGVLLAFWDVMPASSPLQALRRWNGAHTGPLGDRHGLSFILQAARQSAVPVALLDIKSPRSLAALDYLDALPEIREMQNNGLLLIPDFTNMVYTPGVDSALSPSDAFNVKTSKFIYAEKTDLPADYPYIFTELATPGYLIPSCQGQVLIPLSQQTFQSSQGGDAEDNLPVSRSGLSRNLKAQILKTALSGDTTRILVLGGSLPQSMLADSNITFPVFSYLKNHPWINVLDAYDLKRLSVTQQIKNPLTYNDALCHTPYIPSKQLNSSMDNVDVNHILLNIERMPDSSIKDTSLNTLQTQMDLLNNPKNIPLVRQYLGEMGYLFEAAQWAEQPYTLTDCKSDIDNDSKSECILANENNFMVIETDGARLAFAIHKSGKSLTNWVMPSTYLASGLSASEEWQKQNGVIYEPSAVPGAFIDLPHPYDIFRIDESLENHIILSNSDGTISKKFILSLDELVVEYRSAEALQTRILLAQNTPGGYSGWADDILENMLFNSSSVTWGNSEKALLEVDIQNASFTLNTFLDSYPWMRKPEDPNRYYLPGHYLPFGTALINIDSNGPFQVHLHFE